MKKHLLSIFSALLFFFQFSHAMEEEKNISLLKQAVINMLGGLEPFSYCQPSILSEEYPVRFNRKVSRVNCEPSQSHASLVTETEDVHLIPHRGKYHDDLYSINPLSMPNLKQISGLIIPLEGEQAIGLNIGAILNIKMFVDPQGNCFVQEIQKNNNDTITDSVLIDRIEVLKRPSAQNTPSKEEEKKVS